MTSWEKVFRRGFDSFSYQKGFFFFFLLTRSFRKTIGSCSKYQKQFYRLVSPDSSAPLTRLLACSPPPRAENKKRNTLSLSDFLFIFLLLSRSIRLLFFLLPPVVVLFECVGLSPAPGYTACFTAFVFLSLKLQSLRRPSLLIGRVKSLQLLQKKVRVAKMMFSL